MLHDCKDARDGSYSFALGTTLRGCVAWAACAKSVCPGPLFCHAVGDDAHFIGTSANLQVLLEQSE